MHAVYGAISKLDKIQSRFISFDLIKKNKTQQLFVDTQPVMCRC